MLAKLSNYGFIIDINEYVLVIYHVPGTVRGARSKSKSHYVKLFPYTKTADCILAEVLF